ncbi:2-phospho-L-lactate transferase [Parasphingorhabdus sp.]|uniref:2-phospho-L-lactate transferase n=1 Tax=Parasphingorhabdus sp. TaxID=2709688 RepID=UPI003BAFE478
MSARYAVLTGGVGGAKLVDGLYRQLPENSLTAIVNTGDDFRHFGLPISPDIDTLLYTLSGKSNSELGWGREGETWNFMAALKSLGGEDWFNLGDGDLALHVLRAAAFAAGEPLSVIIARFASAWNLQLSILPMSDNPVATWVDTDGGLLPFQSYFVEHQCSPKVKAVHFEGAAEAVPASGVVEAIMESEAVFIAPSNPWLSVDPLLSIDEIRTALQETPAPVVAVSPLIQGKAVKGPTAKLMGELGLETSNQSIASHYGTWLDAMVVHGKDTAPANLPVSRTDTLMTSSKDRERVAEAALQLAKEIAA